MNQQLHHGGVFKSMQNSLFGIMESEGELEQTLGQLQERGFPEQTLGVFSGEREAEAFNEEQEGGFMTKLREVFAADERDIEKAYSNAVAKGYYVIQVELADEEETLNRAARILRDNGAEYLHYFGTWSFRPVSSEEASP